LEAFNIGDAVTWSRADDDVAEGEIGEVVGFRQDTCRVRVHFKKGTWKFKPGSLTIVMAGVLLPGDGVTWENDDEDVPFGTVGEVIEYVSEERVRVKFPKGTWKFKKEQIKLYQRFGFSLNEEVISRDKKSGVVIGFTKDEVKVDLNDDECIQVSPDEIERPEAGAGDGGYQVGDCVTVTETHSSGKLVPGMRGLCL